jgi:2-amino-4-hydroxy-6-hydroxymethyldihydropteridine diphosphokinase
MTKAFIAIGSNINPAENIRKALRGLGCHVHIAGLSTVYLTEPEDRPDQPPYYNCVAAIETDLPPEKLKYEVLRHVEAELGRVRTADRYAPRTIDLDLIVYDDLTIETGDLTLPDPLILRRPFLAAGLCELAPGLRLSKWNQTLEQITAAMPALAMKPQPDYTEQLRKDLLMAADTTRSFEAMSNVMECAEFHPRPITPE